MAEAHELTELQVDVMRVLWSTGGASAQDVRAALSERELAPTTVATLLARLEKRGLVTHETEGRQYVYRAVVSEDEIRGSMVQGLADRLFGGDVAELVSHFLEAHDVAPGDLEKVREMIADKQSRMRRRKRS